LLQALHSRADWLTSGDALLDMNMLKNDPNFDYPFIYWALPTQGKDIVFRIIIEHNSLKGFLEP
jgi:hypothetical protein